MLLKKKIQAGLQETNRRVQSKSSGLVITLQWNKYLAKIGQ